MDICVHDQCGHECESEIAAYLAAARKTGPLRGYEGRVKLGHSAYGLPYNLCKDLFLYSDDGSRGDAEGGLLRKDHKICSA